MKITDFDYLLPENLIAKRPLTDRSSSRLLVVHRDGTVEHRMFSDVVSYLGAGDMLIVNNTKVFPARLTGRRKDGKSLEVLLVKELEKDTWEVLSKGRYTGAVVFSDDFSAELSQRRGGPLFLCRRLHGKCLEIWLNAPATLYQKAG